MSAPAVRTSKEGAVLISYKDLVERPAELRESIERGFGSLTDSLGIVVIEDLPAEFPALRERLLRLANTFASLPEDVREKYADPEAQYSFGWSHGKEVMNGKPDLNKGSYYANPLVDVPNVTAAERDADPMYYRQNVWPNPKEKGLENFEVAFKELGKFIFDVGLLLAKACESFVAESLLDASQSIEKLISTSQCNKARLLHYFAPTPVPDVSEVEEKEVTDDLCGIHLDHSLLTGLCSALYLFHPEDGSQADHPPVCKAPYPDSGLYIIPRAGGKQVKVSIPANCLAFQTGEALQLCTGQRLKATPHYVQAGKGPSTVEVDGVKGTVTRETLAFFLQPDVGAVIDKDGKTFGEFSKEVIAEHY